MVVAEKCLGGGGPLEGKSINSPGGAVLHSHTKGRYLKKKKKKKRKKKKKKKKWKSTTKKKNPSYLDPQD